MLPLAIHLLAAPPPAQRQDKPSGDAATAPILGIEITLPNRDVFYIPVMGKGEILGVIPFPKGRYAGIRIIPSIGVDSVKIGRLPW